MKKSRGWPPTFPQPKRSWSPAHSRCAEKKGTRGKTPSLCPTNAKIGRRLHTSAAVHTRCSKIHTGCTMSVTRTSSTLPGCSCPGRRILPSGKSRARFVASRSPSPPSNAPAEDGGGGRLLGFMDQPECPDYLASCQVVGSMPK